jgi:hypothetical protein
MAPYVRDLIRDHKFKFIYFQEYMLQDLSDECIRNVDPNKIYLWDWIPSKGRARGIISGFNLDRFDMGAGIKGSTSLIISCGIKNSSENVTR